MVFVVVVSELAAGAPVMAQEAQSPAPAQAAKGKVKKPKAASAPAEQAADPGAPAAKDPAVALAAYTAGVKAYQAGKFDVAIESLNTAINNGGLTPVQMPKALYYRGASQQQLGRAGQAISDLTSALWIKPGLDDAERADATKFRTAAYHDAGLDDAGHGMRIEPGDQAGRMSALPSESSSGSSGIGKVFGNLFGGSASEPAPAAAPPPPPAPVIAAAPPAGGPAEVLPWSNQPPAGAAPVEVPAAPAPAAAKPAAKAKTPKAPLIRPAGAPKAGGTVRIQVASVKSRDEASAVIAKIQGLGGAIAAASASVDETTFGANTFYRVKLGPFASTAATAEPCKSLKSQGFDCLVTPN